MHGHDIIFDVENMQIGIVESDCDVILNDFTDNETENQQSNENNTNTSESNNNANSSINSENSEISSNNSSNTWITKNTTNSENNSDIESNVETIIDLNGFKINLSKLNNTEYLNEIKEHFKTITNSTSNNPYITTLQQKGKEISEGINNFFMNVKEKSKNYVNVILIVIIVLLSVLSVVLIVAIFYYKRGEGFLCFKKVNNIAVNNDDSIIIPNDEITSKREYQSNSEFQSTNRKVIDEV